MSGGGNVNLESGAGGIDPFNVDIEIGKGTTVDPGKMEAKVNALPGSGELGESGGVDGVSGGIPRPTVTDGALHDTLSTNSDVRGATGGSSVVAAKQSSRKASTEKVAEKERQEAREYAGSLLDMTTAEVGRSGDGSKDYSIIIKGDNQYKSISKAEIESLSKRVVAGEALTGREVAVLSEFTSAVQKSEFAIKQGDTIIATSSYSKGIKGAAADGVPISKVEGIGVQKQLVSLEASRSKGEESSVYKGITKEKENVYSEDELQSLQEADEKELSQDFTQGLKRFNEQEGSSRDSVSDSLATLTTASDAEIQTGSGTGVGAELVQEGRKDAAERMEQDAVTTVAEERERRLEGQLDGEARLDEVLDDEQTQSSDRARAEAGGYTAVMTGSQLAVTGPGGTQHQGRVEDDGTLTMDIEETDTHGPAHLTFREPPNDDGELTVQVDPLDGTDPEDITIQVDESAEDAPEEALKKEREEDLDKNPEQEMTWIDHLAIICKAMEPLEKWIEAHQGAGKPNI